MQLAEARVLVTGATGGIGSATAHVLRRRGARLVLHGRDAGRLRSMAAVLAAETVVGDLAEDTGPEKVAQESGAVDVIVHCAGIGLRARLPDCDCARIDQLVATNLRAPILLTHALLPAMCAQGLGHVAFVASIAGHTGVGQEAVYAATKAGLLVFAESLALELTGSGVTVSTVSPAAVDTGFWSARGTPYHRSSPRPVDAALVAETIVRDIEAGGGGHTVPRWVGVAPRIRALAPGAYRSLVRHLDGSVATR